MSYTAQCYCCHEEKDCEALAAGRGPWSSAICEKCKWHDWDRVIPGNRGEHEGPLCTPPKYIACLKGSYIQVVFTSQEALDTYVKEYGLNVSRTFCTEDV